MAFYLHGGHDVIGYPGKKQRALSTDPTTSTRSFLHAGMCGATFSSRHRRKDTRQPPVTPLALSILHAEAHREKRGKLRPWAIWISVGGGCVHQPVSAFLPRQGKW